MRLKIPSARGVKYKERNNKLYTCTCGRVLNTTSGGLSRHKNSITCKNAKLVRAMLENSDVSFADVGRRVGLSRERIRQIAKRMGFGASRARKLPT
jgi:hypothetical protein